ncbi:type VI secretion system-associated protein TagF [Paracoccus aurantiacus]|uniref:Type VI secretion system-associated protein TagF n=1 Tax=Paracoccus aurantiacus TaxID=2599412 RepID=A0A5C6S9P9_9RHOB|nr:type VI secretion system-associated protein TagF [Paracoccus aurantiacus]TXB71186.1 type VI secretion system-associated protein TagF [Paracoccus aurantiacus]
MSAERQLNAAALFGKHQAFGDFVIAGTLPGEASGQIMDWLAQVLGGWRDGAGDGWQASFDNAPALRFWIGAQLSNGTALRGVLIPSRDRSGRRFPLAIAQATHGVAPVTDSDQGFHEHAEAALRDLAGAERFDPREAASDLIAALPQPADLPGAGGASFWALNPNRSAQELLAELQTTDIAHAQAARSYWWFAADERAATPSGLLACAGWPGPAEIGWLLGRGNSTQAEIEAAVTSATADEAKA